MPSSRRYASGPVRDDDRVEEICPHPGRQPVEVPQVAQVGGPCELDLERHDPTVAPLDDDVDLVCARMGPEMAGPRPVGLCVDAHREHRQRLEQV